MGRASAQRQQRADRLGMPIIEVPAKQTPRAYRVLHELVMLDYPAPRVVAVVDTAEGRAAASVVFRMAADMQQGGVRVAVLDGYLLHGGDIARHESSIERASQAVANASDFALRSADVVLVSAGGPADAGRGGLLAQSLVQCADVVVLASHSDVGLEALAESVVDARVVAAVVIGRRRLTTWPRTAGAAARERDSRADQHRFEWLRTALTHVRFNIRHIETSTRVVRPVSAEEQERDATHVTYRLLQAIVLTIILLQRIVVPFNGVSVAVPIVGVILVILASRGAVVADRVRTLLYLAAMGACLGAALLASTVFRRYLSVTSLLLLLVVYSAFCYRLVERRRVLYPRVLEFFNKIMTVAAVAALAQWAGQLVGWRFVDLVAVVVPSNYLVADYNTFYPVYYGSDIIKTNGVVFLEPSFCSQFLALALLVQLVLGGKRWRLALYAAALLSTVSGTGIVLLLVGLAALAVQRGGRWAAAAGLTVAAAVLALAFSPLGPVIASRTTESGTQGTSGDARFVRPYVQVATALAQDSATFVVGQGPGAADREVSFFNPGRVASNYPVLSKLAAEYGLVAMIIFAVFVLVVFVRGAPAPPLSPAVATVYFVLSGSLLQPQTIYLCWLLTGLFAASGSKTSPAGRGAVNGLASDGTMYSLALSRRP